MKGCLMAAIDTAEQFAKRAEKAARDADRSNDKDPALAGRQIAAAQVWATLAQVSISATMVHEIRALREALNDSGLRRTA